MGDQHAWKGKHFYLHLAGCVIMLMGLQGCATFSGTTWESEELLKQSRLLLNKGEYESSLRASREVLEKSYTPLGDLALFQIALAYAHPKNPNADIKESIRCFQTIVLDFPDSEVKEEAALWAHTLTKTLEMEKAVRDLQVKLALSEKAGDESKKTAKDALQDLNRTEALNIKLKDQAKDLQARIDQLQAQVEQAKDLQARINQLQAQMESLKKVDLTIEEKKKESGIRQKN